MSSVAMTRTALEESRTKTTSPFGANTRHHHCHQTQRSRNPGQCTTLGTAVGGSVAAMQEWRPTDDPAVGYRIEKPTKRRSGSLSLLRHLGGGRVAISTYEPRGTRLHLVDIRITTERTAEMPAFESGQEKQIFSLSAGRPDIAPEADYRFEISSRLLRNLGLEQDRELATRLAEEHGLLQQDSLDLPADLHGLAKNPRPVFADLRADLARSPGRTGHPDDYFAVISLAYLWEIAQGSKRPVQDAALSLKLDPAYVRDSLHRARVRKLLGPGLKGRPGGALSETGIEALRRVKMKYMPWDT
jgi:hypothetical protein